jgi:hypothetical protein
MKIFEIKNNEKYMKLATLIVSMIVLALSCVDFYYALSLGSSVVITLYIIKHTNREYRVIADDKYIEVILLPTKWLKIKRYIINKSDIKDIRFIKGSYIIKQSNFNVYIPALDNKEFILYMENLISELSEANSDFYKNRSKMKNCNMICILICTICFNLSLLIPFYVNITMNLWCYVVPIVGYIALLVIFINSFRKIK